MFKNITIKTRLYLLTGLMCLMIVIIGSYALQGIRRTVEGKEEVYYGSVDAISDLRALKIGFQDQVIHPFNLFQEKKIDLNQLKASLQGWGPFAEEHLNKYLDLFKEDGKLTKKIRELENLIEKINEEVNKLMVQLQQNETVNTSFNLHVYNNFLIRSYTKLVDDMIDFHIQETQKDYQTSKGLENRTVKNMIIFIVLSVLISFLLAILIVKSILKPLLKAVQTIDQIALGNTMMEIAIDGQDESSKLMQAMKNMNASTTNMTNILEAIANGDLTLSVPIRSENDTLGKGLHSMLNKFRQIISEIQGEVYVLTNSAHEIVHSVNQASTGTAETAAAVTETTTTVEELKQTAYVSADKAKDVLLSAEETLKIVHNTENTLHLTTEEMKQIQEKMEVISESIVKLSEHSMTIGEIINTVNNLAEQSNLLAVNAAIEAAKAGDQGKSFGVVAQEIRTLAEQSKEATVQVKAILNDIQNATSSAVLATEQGSKAVSKGAAQSSQMGEAIQALSTSISRVTQAASQISISSQQQLVGVDQVTVAMANINDASNQHAEHMQQIEKVVNSLNEVAISLKSLVNQYHIHFDDKNSPNLK